MRHHDVKDCGGEIRIILKRLVSFLSVPRADHGESFLFQNHTYQPQDGRIVVGYQHAPLRSFVVTTQLKLCPCLSLRD